MNAVWGWIKWGAVAFTLAALVLTKQRLTTVLTMNEQLAEHLHAADRLNKQNAEAIHRLKTDNEIVQRLLVQRQREHQQAQEALNAEMEQITEQLAGVPCRIPADVTDRLRAPY